MIIKRDITEDDTGKLIECVINSSNILKTNYFAHRNRLFVFFKKGQVYSYSNINEKLYDEFENSESQGKFLIKEIIKNPTKYPYFREFKINESEIDDAKKIIKEWENNKENQV